MDLVTLYGRNNQVIELIKIQIWFEKGSGFENSEEAEGWKQADAANATTSLLPGFPRRLMGATRGE
jgi:hypothetical protein